MDLSQAKIGYISHSPSYKKKTTYEGTVKLSPNIKTKHAL